MRTLFQKIISLLLPKRCIVTGQIVEGNFGLSAEGFKRMDFISEPYCSRCGGPLTYSKEVCFRCSDLCFSFHEARCVFVYNSTNKRLLHQFKYYDKVSHAKLFAHWLCQFGANLINEADYILPIPMHPKKLRERLYNQAAELTKEIEKITGVAVVLDALHRVEDSPAQQGGSRDARFENVRKVFEVDSLFQKTIKGRNLLIVDDVMTTGATLNAAASVLASFDPKKISILTLAKTL